MKKETDINTEANRQTNPNRIYGLPLTEGEPLPEGFIQEPHADYGVLNNEITGNKTNK